MVAAQPGKNDLFRERPDAIINARYPLARLSGLMPWSRFDEAFGGLYRQAGRPTKPTRLMVGLHYLKHVHDLSDEEVVDRWAENPYRQFFGGFDFLQHEAPIDASKMTRWRKRILPEGLEEPCFNALIFLARRYVSRPRGFMQSCSHHRRDHMARVRITDGF